MAAILRFRPPWRSSQTFSRALSGGVSVVLRFPRSTSAPSSGTIDSCELNANLKTPSFGYQTGWIVIALKRRELTQTHFLRGIRYRTAFRRASIALSITLKEKVSVLRAPLAPSHTVYERGKNEWNRKGMGAQHFWRLRGSETVLRLFVQSKRYH